MTKEKDYPAQSMSKTVKNKFFAQEARINALYSRLNKVILALALIGASLLIRTISSMF